MNKIWFERIERRNLFNWMSDTQYLKLKFKTYMGYHLDLDHPKTFNEKLQWLKLYDRNPIYTTMVDKYQAKKYVANIIGDQYIIPTLGVWNHFDDIDFSRLPRQFVLKTTHDSGGVVVVTDKETMDISSARQLIELSLNKNYYYSGREWPYKNVKPRIIAEKYMTDESGTELKDYKFFCFGGQVKCFKVDFDRFIEHHANYYDPEGHILDFGEVVCPPNPEKQLNFDMATIHKMEELAGELSKSHAFLRTDFYDINGKVYFGELTFYPASGFGKFTDKKADLLLGKWIKLPGGVQTIDH